MKRKNVRPSDLEKRQYIIDTMIMRMSEKESIQYLASKGYEMAPRHYYRLKKGIKDFDIEKLVEIGGTQSMINGFMSQHLERIQQVELVQAEYWRLYHSSNKHSEKIAALGGIAQIQPLISSYYEATNLVFGERIREFESKKRLELNPYRTKYDNNPLNTSKDNNNDDSFSNHSNNLPVG